MRKINLVLAFTAMLSSGANADTEKPEDTLVIIGEQIDFHEIKRDGACEKKEVQSNGGSVTVECLVSLDMGFSAKYSVLKVLQGKFDEKTIEF